MYWPSADQTDGFRPFPLAARVCLAIGKFDGWSSSGKLPQRHVTRVSNSRRIVSYDSLPVKRRARLPVEVM